MSLPATRTPLAEIAGLFLRLGLTAFGGPAAHIALMRSEAVERRNWMSSAEFLDLVGACNLLPGPGSTQVAMALGYRRAGIAGLITAGLCFILPSAMTTLALAWAYVRYCSLPHAQGLLAGAKPVMVSILIQVIWKLGQTAYRSWELALVGIICCGAVALGAPPIFILLASGGLASLALYARSKPGATASVVWLPSVIGGGTAATAGLTSIFLVFLKLGVVVFGSGYVLLAFFQADLVDRLHWVTQQQLLDAVTAGQLTPGPVFASAAFLGYVIHGWSGAALAATAIFLPSFPMAGAAAALAVRIRQSRLASAFLNGVNAAAVALMAAVAVTLGRAALVSPFAWAVGAISLLLLIRFKINSTWVILAGAAAGLFFF